MLQVLAIVQSSVLLHGCSLGLGASMVHMSSSKQIKIQKACRCYALLLRTSADISRQIYYTGNLFWVLVMGLSKISVAYLLQRIDPFGRRKNVFNTVAAFLVAWTIGSLFAIALQCDLTNPWITLHQSCKGVVWSCLLDDADSLTTSVAVSSMAGHQRFGHLFRTSVTCCSHVSCSAYSNQVLKKGHGRGRFCLPPSVCQCHSPSL